MKAHLEAPVAYASRKSNQRLVLDKKSVLLGNNPTARWDIPPFQVEELVVKFDGRELNPRPPVQSAAQSEVARHADNDDRQNQAARQVGLRPARICLLHVGQLADAGIARRPAQPCGHLRIPYFARIQVEQPDSDPRAQLELAQFVEAVGPVGDLAQSVGERFRDQYVPGVATVHQSLSGFDALTGRAYRGARARDTVHGPGVNSHSDLELGIALQVATYLARAAYRGKRIARENENHALLGGHGDHLTHLISPPKLGRPRTDSQQAAQEPRLLVHRQLPVAHNLDRKDVSNFESAERLTRWVGPNSRRRWRLLQRYRRITQQTRPLGRHLLLSG